MYIYFVMHKIVQILFKSPKFPFNLKSYSDPKIAFQCGHITINTSRLYKFKEKSPELDSDIFSYIILYYDKTNFESHNI